MLLKTEDEGTDEQFEMEDPHAPSPYGFSDDDDGNWDSDDYE